MKTVEFLYDYASPASYLAWTQLPGLCVRHGAELVRLPVFAGGIFKAVGNNSPVNVKPKGVWMFDDLGRYARHYGVPFEKNPHFMFNSLAAMRGAMWARSQGRLADYDRAMFEAAWVTGRNIGAVEELKAIIADAGIDADAMLDAIQQADVKQTLVDETGRAVERGAFGVPTMFVDGVMHFGQDRLTWVERALSGEGTAP